MLNKLKIAFRFLNFYLKAKTKYNVHSPFVYDFVTEVLEDDRQFYVFREAEVLRGQLIASKDKIEVEDLGAGSHEVGKKKTRSIASIAQSALSPDFQCQWLFRIVNLYKPLTIIELGTSLGVSTLYITDAGGRQTKVFTLEGSSEIAKVANRNFDWFYETFEKIGLRKSNAAILEYDKYKVFLNKNTKRGNIQIIEGNFDDTLQGVLDKVGRLDIAFIDGNHQKEPTLRYFEQCLAHIHEQSVLIFDDIHWSEEMEMAWGDIKNHPKVRCSIDLFWCGIVFFRNENREKEHFNLIKASWKPFNWGFFS